MLLELKEIKDHLQLQLRKLLRKAKKAELDIYCLSTGFLEENLHFSQAAIGPWSLTRQQNLTVYYLINNQYHISKFPIELHQDLDIQHILDVIQSETTFHTLPQSQNSDHDHFEVEHVELENIDEKLLSIDHQECADFFRSRFLIDAPRKVLYEGRIARGAMFQVYMDENGPFINHAHSYYRIDGDFRSRTARFRLQSGGQSLQEMRLSRIRPLCQPFWTSEPIQLQKDEIPEDLILNTRGCSDLLRSLLDETKGNPSDVPFGEHWTGGDNLCLGLVPKNISQLKPICKVIANELRIPSFPKGLHTQSLHQRLDGDIERPTLYFQSILIDRDEDQLFLSNKGSSLLIRPDGHCSTINEPISVALNIDHLRMASHGPSTSFIPEANRRSVITPDHILIRDVELKIH